MPILKAEVIVVCEDEKLDKNTMAFRLGEALEKAITELPFSGEVNIDVYSRDEIKPVKPRLQ